LLGYSQYPPATAGGTDSVQVRPYNYEAKPNELCLDTVSTARGSGWVRRL